MLNRTNGIVAVFLAILFMAFTSASAFWKSPSEKLQDAAEVHMQAREYSHAADKFLKSYMADPANLDSRRGFIMASILSRQYGAAEAQTRSLIRLDPTAGKWAASLFMAAGQRSRAVLFDDDLRAQVARELYNDGISTGNLSMAKEAIELDGQYRAMAVAHFEQLAESTEGEARLKAAKQCNLISGFQHNELVGYAYLDLAESHLGLLKATEYVAKAAEYLPRTVTIEFDERHYRKVHHDPAGIANLDHKARVHDTELVLYQGDKVLAISMADFNIVMDGGVWKFPKSNPGSIAWCLVQSAGTNGNASTPVSFSVRDVPTRVVYWVVRGEKYPQELSQL